MGIITGRIDPICCSFVVVAYYRAAAGPEPAPAVAGDSPYCRVAEPPTVDEYYRAAALELVPFVAGATPRNYCHAESSVEDRSHYPAAGVAAAIALPWYFLVAAFAGD